MFKSLIAAALIAAFAAPVALAGPAERLGRVDKRLTAAEIRGNIAQGSRADHAEDRLDRFENKIDRRESRRREDRIDRRH